MSSGYDEEAMKPIPVRLAPGALVDDPRGVAASTAIVPLAAWLLR
jgi:hypothetical protein